MSTPIRVFLFAALTYSCSGPSFTAEDTRGLGFSGSSGAPANDGGKSGSASVGGSSSIAGSTSSGGALAGASGSVAGSSGESGAGGQGEAGTGGFGSSGGSGSTGGASGAAGTAGQGGSQPNVNPCDFPAAATGDYRMVRDCDAICGSQAPCACAGEGYLSGSGSEETDPVVDMIVIVGTDRGCSFCTDPGYYAGYKIGLSDGTCARITTQPGSDVVYAIDDGDHDETSCAIVRTGCAVVQDDPYSSPDPSDIVLSSTGAPGWARIEIVTRSGLTCPLACP